MEQNKGVEDIYPLSPLQEGILFHSLYAPRAGMYVVQMSFKLRGALDPAALLRAWQEVVERHPVLRTLFVWERREKPLQVVLARAALPWAEHDWRGLGEEAQRARLADLLEADQRQGFALARAPLMRVALVRLDAEAYQVVWSFHHLLLDGWSVPLLLNEVMELYHAHCLGRAPALPRPRPYRDHIAWLRQQRLSEAEAFWRHTLEGFRAPTPLGVGRKAAAPSEGDFAYGRREISLAPGLTADLQKCAAQHGLTLNTLVVGALALLLSRYSGEEDVLFGVCTSGRPAEIPGVERMVGMFINTLPLRARVAPGAQLLAWLRGLQEHQVEIRQYEYSPLVQIQGWSEVPPQTPLFESLFIFENYPLVTTAVGDGDGGGVEILDTQVTERTNYPLTLVAVPGARLTLRALYEAGRFDAATIDRLLGHLETLLRETVADPRRPIAQLPLLSEGERSALLALSDGPRQDAPADVCIHELIEEQARRTPDAPAVSAGPTTLTYAELNRRADQLARYLQKLSVGAESRVGVCLERSAEMVVAILGVLKAGGAYLPLDPSYPRERLAFMLEDSGASVLITRGEFAGHLPAERVRTVLLDREAQAVGAERAEAVERRAAPDNLAYVIYTSGSTGRPKGVAVTHANVVHSTAARRVAYAEPVRAFLLLSSFSFDSSVAGIFWTLCGGGRLVVPAEGEHQDPAHLARLIGHHAVSHMVSLPSFYALLLEQAGAGVLSGLTYVVVAGEACPAGVVEAHRQLLPRVALRNEYGPTENTVWCTVYDCLARAPEDDVPIGRAIAGTQVYVLDTRLELQPQGVTGELYVGGRGVARGYHARAALTAERFVPDPFAVEPGRRLYRTGDLARYGPDGEVEFLGRVDHQVKVRGFRIELGEIESALGQHPSVREAVVAARTDAAGESQLTAYVVPAAQGAPSETELRAFLRERLPAYMVPAAFMTLDALPLAPNGKVERRALPEPGRDAGAAAGPAPAPPETELQRRIAAIWQEVLKVERVGIHDNFFDLGGHSLRMIQVLGKLQAALQREIPLTDLFKYPTVGALAESLSAGDGAAEADPDLGRVEKLRAGANLLRQRAKHRQVSG